MKVRITIFQSRHWSKEAIDGDTIEKWFYAGFPEKGKPLEFSTNRDDIEVHEGMMHFEKDSSEEFDLESVFDSFKGQMKLREVGSAGK